MKDSPPEWLDREWLPDRLPPLDGEALERRIVRLMAEAEPRLARLRERSPRWWEVLGAWWRPVAGVSFAAAAAALALLLGSGPETRGPGALALHAAAAEGDPVALWTALGSEADPVLALIALEGEER